LRRPWPGNINHASLTFDLEPPLGAGHSCWNFWEFPAALYNVLMRAAKAPQGFVSEQRPCITFLRYATGFWNVKRRHTAIGEQTDQDYPGIIQEFVIVELPQRETDILTD
ncbi:hypothetical protein, partial [Paramagnetospirillum marisnigri]|uniref:hypothetical protein n=1 Tax=Paramagnetospirillum marisnigri TaxID=1285242 RepID=UPI001C12ADA6